jgi:hypothetical protein
MENSTSPPPYQFSHPMLKGFIVSLLISLLYVGAGVFVVFNPYYFGPGMFWLLFYSFLPVLFGVNIGVMAAYLKSKYHSLRGIGRYSAGVAIAAVLDFVLLLVLFVIMLVILTVGSGGQ